MRVPNIETISDVVDGDQCVDLMGDSRIWFDSAPDRRVFVSFSGRGSRHGEGCAGVPAGAVLNIRIDADGRSRHWLMSQAIEERARLLRPFAAVFVALYAERCGLKHAARIMRPEKIGDLEIRDAVRSLTLGDADRGYEILGLASAPPFSGTARIIASAVSYPAYAYGAGVGSPLFEQPHRLDGGFSPTPGALLPANLIPSEERQ